MKKTYITPDMLEINLVARDLMDVANLLIHSGNNNQNPDGNTEEGGSFADEGTFDEDDDVSPWDRLNKINLWND